jgi:hypothetical protein
MTTVVRPSAIVNGRPMLSSEWMLYKDYDPKCSVEKNYWSWVSRGLIHNIIPSRMQLLPSRHVSAANGHLQVSVMPKPFHCPLTSHVIVIINDLKFKILNVTI